MKRILLAILMLGLFSACRPSASVQGLQEGDLFVDFPLTAGREAFSAYAGRGSFLLVYYWASWSAPSVEQLSRLEQVAAGLPAGKVVPLALALCDRPSEATELASRFAPSLPLAVSGDAETARLLGIDTLPALMLFGPDGTLLKRDLRWRDLPKILRYTGDN